MFQEYLNTIYQRPDCGSLWNRLTTMLDYSTGAEFLGVEPATYILGLEKLTVTAPLTKENALPAE